MIKEVLKDHTSEETAYLVDDYPYGFKLRTQIRYWIETKAKKGQRFVSQTKNPKTGRWNKPKKSTYSDIYVMFLNENGHVKTGALNIAYSNQEDYDKWIAKVGRENLSDYQQKVCKWALAAYETRKYVTVTIKNGPTTEEDRVQQAKVQNDMEKLFAYNLKKQGVK